MTTQPWDSIAAQRKCNPVRQQSWQKYSVLKYVLTSHWNPSSVSQTEFCFCRNQNENISTILFPSFCKDTKRQFVGVYGWLDRNAFVKYSAYTSDWNFSSAVQKTHVSGHNGCLTLETPRLPITMMYGGFQEWPSVPPKIRRGARLPFGCRFERIRNYYTEKTTVFLSILNQMEIHLVQNRKENCHHDHIPFNVKGIGSIVLSVCEDSQTAKT